MLLFPRERERERERQIYRMDPKLLMNSFCSGSLEIKCLHSKENYWTVESGNAEVMIDPNAQLCCWTYVYWKFGISTPLVSGSEFLSEDQVVGITFSPRPKGNLCSHNIESRNPTLPHNLPLLPIVGDISSALSPGWLIGINHFLAWDSYVSIYNIQLDLLYWEEAVTIVDPKPWWFILTSCRVLTC